MGPEQTSETRFDVLVIDDICSFLTPRLVTLVKLDGSDLLGVFSPADGPDAKRRLLECGITDVIESDASPEEFVAKILATITHKAPAAEMRDNPRIGWSVGVTGVTGGVGATEMALGLAGALAAITDVGLVDLDPVWPSVAQRLDLPLYPNLRTAVDMTMQNQDDLSQAFHSVGRIKVVGGTADRGVASPIPHPELNLFLNDFSGDVDVLVADLGRFDQSIRGVLREMDTVALVSGADPVAVTRALHTIESLVSLVDPSQVLVVANLFHGRRFYLSEIRAELQAAYPDVPVVTVRLDGRISDAAWNGRLPSRGSFTRTMRQIAALIPTGPRS